MHLVGFLQPILNPVAAVYSVLFNVNQRCILPNERIYIYIYVAFMILRFKIIFSNGASQLTFVNVTLCFLCETGIESEFLTLTI